MDKLTTLLDQFDQMDKISTNLEKQNNELQELCINYSERIKMLNKLCINYSERVKVLDQLVTYFQCKTSTIKAINEKLKNKINLIKNSKKIILKKRKRRNVKK